VLIQIHNRKTKPKKNITKNFYFRLFFEFPELMIEEYPIIRNRLISFFTNILDTLNEYMLRKDKNSVVTKKAYLITDILNWIENTYSNTHLKY
jgi:hypothetical protein